MELKQQIKTGCFSIAIVLLYPILIDFEVFVIFVSNPNTSLSVYKLGFINEIIILLLPSVIIITVIPKILSWYINTSNQPEISPKEVIYLIVGFSLLTITVIELIVTLISFYYRIDGTHAIIRAKTNNLFSFDFLSEVPELSLRMFNILISILIIFRGRIVYKYLTKSSRLTP